MSVKKVAKYYDNVIDNKKYNEDKIEDIEIKSMTDSDIKFYFPNCKIYNVRDFKNINHIFDLLPNKKDYCFILYEVKPNMGHWVLLTRNNNLISYFDSYGRNIDNPLKWVKDKYIINSLDLKPYLSKLLKQSNNIIYDYNGVDFQNKNDSNMSTCGRHCCLRLKMFLNNNFDLDDYIDVMKDIKKNTNHTYDEIVSILINKI
jgi:hypothetical protein